MVKKKGQLCLQQFPGFQVLDGKRMTVSFTSIMEYISHPLRDTVGALVKAPSKSYPSPTKYFLTCTTSLLFFFNFVRDSEPCNALVQDNNLRSTSST